MGESEWREGSILSVPLTFTRRNVQDHMFFPYVFLGRPDRSKFMRGRRASYTRARLEAAKPHKHKNRFPHII